MPAPMSVEAPRVALAALPVAVAALAIVAATSRAGWPRWTPRRPIWHGVEAVPVQAAFFCVAGVVSLTLAANTNRPVAEFAFLGILAAAPAAFLVAWALRVNLRGVPWSRGSGGEIARSARLGAAGFLLAVVPTYAVHFTSLAAMQRLGFAPIDHPFGSGPSTALGGWMAYALALCVAAPLTEELVSRVIVLPWASRRAANAALVFFAAAIVGTALGGDYGPAALGLVAAAGLIAVAVSAVPARLPRRTVGGILASGVLFANLHANVWPTPGPLLVLACVLGWVAARSGGVVAPAVLHGLFNAVAVLRVGLG